MRKIIPIIAIVILAMPARAAEARDVYVSKATGSNSNPGTKEEPKKLLWKVLSEGELQAGDHIYVAEGVYNGQKKLGVMPKLTVGQVVIEGGWTTDFSARDPFAHLTIICAAPDKQGETREVFQYEGTEAQITIDGFCIDRGPGCYYYSEGEAGANKKIEGHVDNSPWGYRAINKKKSGSDPSIELLGKGAFTVRNNLIINSPWWGIYVKSADGELIIENNLVLGYRGRGIEAIATGGGGDPKWSIRNNTIAFGSSDEGRALSIDPRDKKGYGKYVVERNVLAFGAQSGVMTKFGAKGDALTLNDNLFFLFVGGDAGDGGSPTCNSDEFEDELDCNNEGNVHECPKFITKMEQAWLDRWSQKKGNVKDPYAKDEEIVAARKLAGLGDWKLAGYDETYSTYAKLPGGRTNYDMSRYPRPFKKGEGDMDWTKSVIPLIGADGERGVQPFSAGD